MTLSTNKLSLSHHRTDSSSDLLLKSIWENLKTIKSFVNKAHHNTRPPLPASSHQIPSHNKGEPTLKYPVAGSFIAL
jgi:hypothetical protein